jgi:hypothetical protein
MEEFSNVSKARESYALFAAALNTGRDILQRAGIATAPPAIPEFDAVFRRLDASLRQELYTELHRVETLTTADAMRIWQPLLKRASAVGSRR